MGLLGRRSRAPLRFRSVGFGEPFRLAIAKDGVAVGELYLHAEWSTAPRVLTVVARRRGDDAENRWLASAFPQRIARHTIARVRAERKAIELRVTEVPCTDDDFEDVPSNTREPSACTPLVGRSSDFEGILIAAPRVVHFARSLGTDRARDCGPAVRPVPKVIVAGIRRYGFAALRAAGMRHLADDGDPALHIIDESTGAGIPRTIETIAREYRHAVLGMNVSYAPAPFPPRDLHDAPGGEGSVFNADIGLYIQRPAGPGPRRYVVHAEYGPYRSNQVVIAVEA